MKEYPKGTQTALKSFIIIFIVAENTEYHPFLNIFSLLRFTVSS